jgi:hypothetical protein
VKSIIAAILAVLLTASAALAQGAAPSAALQKRGKTRLITGAVFVACGFFVAIDGPTGHENGAAARDTTHIFLPLVLTSTGGVIMLLGARDQRRANQPTLSVGVSVGRATSVNIKRSW